MTQLQLSSIIFNQLQENDPVLCIKTVIMKDLGASRPIYPTIAFYAGREYIVIQEVAPFDNSIALRNEQHQQHWIPPEFFVEYFI